MITDTTADTEYKVDGGAWTHYDTQTTISGLQIKERRKGQTDAYEHFLGGTTSHTGIQPKSGKVKVSGYIADVLDWEKRQDGSITYADSCFYRMFFSQYHIVDISELVIPDTVTKNMWKEAFRGCTALTKVWDTLPAKKAADSCYTYMFFGCTSLIAAPEIMIEEPALQCFARCFEGCTALATVQEKPYFTKAFDECFYCMFKDCTSLKTGLDLSGITGFSDQYGQCIFYGMYQGCSSLTSATLPKTFDYANGGVSAFAYMFKGCTSLVTAPAFPDFSTFSGTSFTTAHHFESMYEGCTSLKELPPAITWYPTVTSRGSVNEWWRTFKGCTSITTVPDNYFAVAPKITNTGYSWSEFSETFNGCTSLTSIGRIFGDNYNTESYIGTSYMFYNCTKLASMPTDTWFCTKYDVTSMFEGCTSLTSAQGITLHSSTDGTIHAKATNMFKGCTSLTSVGILITDSSPICTSMFEGCTALKKIDEDFLSSVTKTSSSSCKAMFSGCTSLIRLVKLPATSLVADCYRDMFKGCTSIKLSTTKVDFYTKEYRIPTTGTGVIDTTTTTTGTSLIDMFTDTGGTFTGTPELNTTYYLFDDGSTP